jgi:hypothetical protein
LADITENSLINNSRGKDRGHYSVVLYVIKNKFIYINFSFDFLCFDFLCFLCLLRQLTDQMGRF